MSKKRILKILGVALTLSLVFSLAAVFTATPVAADPDEWSTYDLPDAGEDGDYFWDNTIAAGPGPIDRDIDGYFWAYVDIGGTDEIVKSTDTEGRAWEVTDYSADAIAGAVVGIACSPEDEDVVYVAISDATGATDAVYKTVDGGDAWNEVSDVSAALAVATEALTCITVGYANDEPWVYVGSLDGGAGFGDVYVINDVAFGGTWTELEVDGEVAADLSNVHGIAASPDFDNDALVAVLAIAAADTYVTTNEGADVGTWTSADIEDDANADFIAVGGSNPVFPDDFDIDDAYEFFVGVDGPAHTVGAAGGVYRIYGDADEEEELLDDCDADIISLSLAGDQGNTYLLAGTNAADVWYSDDDGDNWLQAADEGIQPSGTGDTYVIADADIADDGIGWAAVNSTDNDGAAMNLTLTGGESWVGIGLMDSDANALVDIGPSPDWVSDEIMFVLSTNADGDAEILRYDGTNWERVWESDDQYASELDMIDCSPEFGSDEILYAAWSTAGAGAGAEVVFLSEDSGTVWAETRNAPGSLASWVIVDSDTIIAGGDLAATASATVYVTDRQGRRAWDDYEVEAADTSIVSLAVSGDIVIAGNSGSDVYISEDLAETWDVVGAQVDAGAVATYVAFDTDDISTIYAATGDTIARFLDTSELDEDWENFTEDALSTLVATTGIACADGVLYVTDPTAVILQTGVAGIGRGAIQRSVNPLEDVDDVDESEFDFVDAELAAGEIFDMLYMTTGSTILWTVDTVAATIWTYEDVLGVVATGGVADPDEDSASLTWDGFDNATDYEVRVYSDEDMGMAHEWFDALTADDDPILNVTDGNTTGVNLNADLDAGTQYWWQVRAAEPVLSKWSDVWDFTTLPGTMTIDADQFGPAIGATKVPIMPSFGWQDIEEADEYMFELADNPDFTTPIVSTTTTNPVFQLDAALDYATNYFWRVKAISGTGESRWATGTFTTMAEPVEPPAPPPAAEAPTLTIPPTEEVAPNWIYAIIGIGAALAVVVIVLIAKTRKP